MEALINDRVRFNVGGRIFETTSTTLANAGRGSFFGAMLDDNWNLRQPQDSPANTIPEYFIDRNPDYFNILLDLLRTKILYIPPHLPENLLYKEAQFYGLTSLLRASKWAPMDPNRLKLSHSISGQDSGEGVAIRASPDGGCCTVHGCIVHVYDWTMNQHSSPFNLDYQSINDVCYVDSERIVVSAWEKSGEVRGGLGLFNSSTSELTHRFPISHGNQGNKSYTAGALSYSLNNHNIFASCRGRSNEYGIGVWDEVTGQQADFFYEPFGWSLGDADRLQWLQSYNCLLVATMYPRKDHCYISLLDFRCKRMVWSWSDMENIGKVDDDKRVRDAIAMEGSGTICVVNDYEDLGFMDLRGSVGSSNGVRWRSQSRLMSRRLVVGDDETCFPKLATHQGRIFRSMNDSVLVHSGPEWIVTSRLKSSRGGSIYDFAIGGDRLFVLHNEHDVFDVWETTPLC